MNRPTVRQVNFVDFKTALGRATATGTRIERSDKERWTAFVAKNGVKEAGFVAYAKSHSESLQPVIIDEPAPGGGYFLYSERDEVCLKWIPRTV